MFFTRLRLNLLRLTQPCKSLTCRLLIHRLVGLQLGKLLACNWQLAAWQTHNSLARNVIDLQLGTYWLTRRT